MIKVIPAIDLRNGKCVRLKQGEFSRQKIYSNDPVAVAADFEKSGAEQLHVVDLDGAESGLAANSAIVQEILSSTSMTVQMGGGIRSLDDVERWLGLGLASVIIGTMAVRKHDDACEAIRTFGPEHIILSVDAREGSVAVDGWQTDSGISAVELALDFKQHGLQRVLYTDINRDGMFSGPAIVETKDLAQQTGLKVTASGGVSGVADITALAALEEFGVDSVIVGKAFYEGRIKPEEVFNAR